MPQTKGQFIPTTSSWDISELDGMDVKSDAFKELLRRLYQNLNNMALSVNAKDSGSYSTNETVCGQQFFQNPDEDSNSAITNTARGTYRKVINCGALPNAATKNVPHHLTMTEGYTFTRIYGAASIPVSGSNSFIPLPYVATTTYSDVSLRVSGVNVILHTTANMSSFTKTYVVLEYLKN
jgi:hypothetical protein